MALSEGGGRWPLAALIALAVAARLAVIAPRLGQPPDDPDNYLPLARTLAEGRGFLINGRPSAYRPPLYPLVLAPLVRLLDERRLMWGVAALHLALGAGTVSLTYVASRRWGLSPRRGLVAAAVVALDPVLVVQSRSVMTETLAAFLLASSFAGLGMPGWRGPVLGGLAFGLGGLCRPSTLSGAAVTALAAVAFGPGGLRERVGRAALLVAATAVMLAPWAIRNAIVLGEPVWTTTHGGYTLALANNPTYYREVLDGPPDAVWSGEDQFRWFDRANKETAGMSEPQADRYLRRQALRMLEERPRTFARATAARLGRFWGIAPSGKVYQSWLRTATAAWTVPLWAALALGLVNLGLWAWPRVSAPASILALTAVHAVFWTDLRMRAPIVPAIALIAAGARAPRGPFGGRKKNGKSAN